ITITSGRSGDNWLLVPKVNLVSQLQVLVQQQRILIAAELPLATLLRQELLDFRVKISQAGIDTYEALTESAHDDIVTALALAVLRPHLQRDPHKWVSTAPFTSAERVLSLGPTCWMTSRKPGHEMP